MLAASFYHEQRYEPGGIIDLATLNGAILVAFELFLCLYLWAQQGTASATQTGKQPTAGTPQRASGVGGRLLIPGCAQLRRSASVGYHFTYTFLQSQRAASRAHEKGLSDARR